MSSKDITVVLVHGAWADGSSWARVIQGLHAEGHAAVAAQLPLTSFEDDVAALDRTVRRIGGPVVLAGHAYAGAVIGAARADSLKALVYVAALAPDEGESVADVFYRTAPHPSAPALAPDADGLIWMPDDAFGRAVAPEAPDDDLAVLTAAQKPIAVAAITFPVGRPRWRDTPTWYLVAEHDRMILADNQRFMAGRMGARQVAHPVDHTPQLARPDLVTNLIREAIHG